MVEEQEGRPPGGENPPPRDDAQVERALEEWLRGKLPQGRQLRISHWQRPPGSGFSNDTVLFRLSWQEEGKKRTQPLVVRLEPVGYPVFPFYDLGRQFRIMQALERASDVPVPRCLWYEEDAAVLGGSFFIMEQLRGEVPSDHPPYPVEGFVKDASPEQRAALWWDGLEKLARVHCVNPRRAGLDFLAWPRQELSPIEQHLEYYAAYLEWAAQGRSQPVAEAALAWLRENQPLEEPEGIVWGDARIGNQMFREGSVVAVMDWEMAALGSPETDLGWWLFVDEVTMQGNGRDEMARPRLAGLPSREETVRRYEELMERPVRHLEYYEVFAGLRFACVMIRIMQQQGHAGVIPWEYVPLLERDNVVTRLTAQRLGLPPPG